jgi:anti-sigma B factor antagonist
MPTTTRPPVHVHEVLLEVVDHSTVSEFKRQVRGLATPGARLVLDMGRVRFIDSSGLGALLSTLRSLAATGGDLKICGSTPAVRVVFELVRLHRVVDVLESREDAVAAFGD